MARFWRRIAIEAPSLRLLDQIQPFLNRLALTVKGLVANCEKLGRASTTQDSRNSRLWMLNPRAEPLTDPPRLIQGWQFRAGSARAGLRVLLLPLFSTPSMALYTYLLPAVRSKSLRAARRAARLDFSVICFSFRARNRARGGCLLLSWSRVSA
jgi:hypothetical protein